MSIASSFSELSRANKVSLFFLTLINMQDGFDILAISFAAGAIANDWGINRAELGWVFSAALFGMLIGAAFLSSYADKFGRKNITILGLFLSGVGMIIAATAPDYWVLLIGRFITGIGVGAIITSLNTLVSEYSGPKLRSTMIALFQLGFPIGAVFAGYVCLWLLDIATWRHVFAFGAFLSFLFIPIMYFLPESDEFLKNREAIKRDKININVNSYQQLFSKTYITRTVLISLAFFLQLLILYFLLSWVPKLIVDLGFPASEGNRAGRLINMFGMIGVVVIGFLALRFNVKIITCVFFFGLSFILILVATSNVSMQTLLMLIAFSGFFTHGAMIGLYSTVPALFPVELRATGSGWAIGISRLGAVGGPITAGYLLGVGVSEQQLFLVYAPIAILAAVIILWLYVHMRTISIE